MKSQVTASALAGALGGLPYPDLVDMALKYHAEDGADAILEAVLDPWNSGGHEDLVQELIGKLSDPQANKILMQRLQSMMMPEEHKPFKCPVIGCEKAYKNQNGLK